MWSEWSMDKNKSFSIHIFNNDRGTASDILSSTSVLLSCPEARALSFFLFLKGKESISKPSNMQQY